MVYFVLPVYNEEKGIARQLELLRLYAIKKKIDSKIIVVNDGSKDRSLEIIHKTRETVDMDILNHSENYGPGKTFKSAFEYLLPKLNNDDIVITLESDSTQNLKTIKLMIHKIQEGYDVVIGEGLAAGGVIVGIPFFRIILSYAASLIYKIFFPIRGIKIYTGFLRAVKASALKKAYHEFGNNFIESKGFSCMAEMLIKYRRLSLLITSAPVIIRYDLKTSKSKLRIVQTIKEHLYVIAKNFQKRNIIFE